jgi:hypothetical protein
MSLKGHLRKSRIEHIESAIPLIATVKADMPKLSFSARGLNRSRGSSLRRAARSLR